MTAAKNSRGGGEARSSMRFSSSGTLTVALAAAAVMLGACQGNIGSGGLSIPGPPAYTNPQGPGGEGTQSRQRVVEGAVFLASDLKELPLPTVDGFAVAVELGSLAPASPSPAASAAGRARSNRAARAGGKGTIVAFVASTAPSPRPSPPGSPAPQGSAAPRAGASTAPSGGARGVPAGPAAAPPGSNGGTSGAPAASPGAAPSVPASPGAAPRGPKIATKTTVYPDDAPSAPSPQPSGDVQIYAVRKPIVRGYLMAPTPLDLYGLAALRFTIPAQEQKDGRGFTIALFEAGRHRHNTLVAFDADAKLSGDVVSAAAAQPLVLKKDTGYLLMLYGDELPATPGPVESGYSAPGNNPFPGPSGSSASGAPVYPQQPGTPVQPAGRYGATPSPYGPPNPYSTSHP